jgi:hypothetical protein
MNPQKLEQLRKGQQERIRTGGKGSVRRTKFVFNKQQTCIDSNDAKDELMG